MVTLLQKKLIYQEVLTFNIYKTAFTVPEVNKDHDPNLEMCFLYQDLFI